MSRYDSILYDDFAKAKHQKFKAFFEDLEDEIDLSLRSARAKVLAHTKLEEAYMWIGKAIRDDQIERNATAEVVE